MIEIIPLRSSQTNQFENYDQLFDYITEIENLKLLKSHPSNKNMNWSFTIYPPQQVSALFAYCKDQDDSVRIAFEEDVSLIEICVGSYKHPIYIVNTPNIDLDYLKRKWCHDYCTFHDHIIRDYFKIYRGNLNLSWESLSCLT